MLRLKVFDLLTGQHPSVVVFMTGQRQAVALNGVDDEEVVVDEKGDVWSLEMDGSDRETSKWNTDEYGDRSFMWEYR